MKTSIAIFVIYALWFSGCMLIDRVLTSKGFNLWFLRRERVKASKFVYRDKVLSWIDDKLCADNDNEVLWKDIQRMIRKDTGIKVSMGVIRGLMYEKGYKTVSDTVLDTYIFCVKYKGEK